MGLASSDLCAPAGENTVDEAEQEEVPSEKDEQLRESDTGHNPRNPSRRARWKSFLSSRRSSCEV
ncbi:hypothetical protein SO694_0018501 [Aureococcus anophagefferens]|uniref:Uncharacterized protein n=1 Tax=Aureococcus anophagefferens TaxID=44056 RepID=A0ABR1FG68_AURAN